MGECFVMSYLSPENKNVSPPKKKALVFNILINVKNAYTDCVTLSHRDFLSEIINSTNRRYIKMNVASRSVKPMH